MRIREFFKRIKEFFIYLFSRENIFKVVAGAVAFAVSFTVIFLVTNGRKVEGKLPVKHEEEVTTYFERFTGKMLDKLDNPEDSISTKITIDNLTLSYGDEETPASASLNGDMVFKANSRDDISFTVDLESSLFNLTNRLAFGYVNKNVYISNGKKGVKTSIETCKEAIEYLKETVGSIELPFETGGDLTETLMNLADSGLLGSIEPVETVYETYALVQISNETMDVSLQINKESYLLESLTINSIKLGDAEITGKVNLVGVTEIIPFDDFRYQRHMGTFKDGVVYLNWLKDVHDVFAREKLGMNMTTLVSDPDNDEQLVATINSKMNVNFNGGINFSKPLFDILLEDDFTKLEMSIEFSTEMEESGEVIAAGITQFEQDGYVEIDSPETSLKAKIENDDMVFISERISDLMGSLMQKEKKVSRSIVSDAQDYIQDIIDYLTSGEIIKAIRTLDLSSLGKMLKESDTVDGSSYVVLDLSNLGLGDSVNASFIVDKNLLSEGNISEISISNLVVGGMIFDCLITVNEFNESKIKHVKSNIAEYKQIDVSLLKYTLGTINSNLLYTKGTISIQTPEGALFGLTISPEIYFTLEDGKISFFIDMGIDVSGIAALIRLVYRTTRSQIIYDSQANLVYILRYEGSSVPITKELTIEEFTENPTQYLLADVLGMDDSILSMFFGNESSETTRGVKRDSKESINILDSVISFIESVQVSGNTYSWNTVIDLSSLIQGGMIGDVNVRLIGKAEEGAAGSLTNLLISTQLTIEPFGDILVDANFQFDSSKVFPEAEYERLLDYFA